MRASTEKPKATQQTASTKPTMPNQAQFMQSREVNSMLRLQQVIGNQAVLQSAKSDAGAFDAGLAGMTSPLIGDDSSPIGGTLQAKLAINTPGNEYEQEADRVSEQVMRMPEPQLQRACPSSGGSRSDQAEQPGAEHIRLQRKYIGASSGTLLNVE